jgi:hypothetical protein
MGLKHAQKSPRQRLEEGGVNLMNDVEKSSKLGKGRAYSDNGKINLLPLLAGVLSTHSWR